ncbi:restriction endonuclease subunit S [Formosa sp. L2A11]|uniref:restriction endonuclease subunit S n=1 Tax=Formosa sp. L2A11 TaxID=2686363 RepID=UPI00131ED172|nr:restriction endonuclease subunit S [Formosa sp. L2A11]
MNKEKQKLVPELRFPEFKNDGDWTIEPFNEVYSFKITNSFSRDKLNYENGTVKNIHYGDIHTKFSTHFDITKENVPYINPDISIERIDKENYCEEGDLVIADASEDIDDIGKSIEIINLNKEKLLAGLHTFLARPINSKITISFGGHLFKSEGIIIQIKKEAQGAKVLGISKGRLANLDIYYPENEKEQQKIANCLSSLDNLITAETEKLDCLKDHKKGLLQQLFPAIGETKPQFRFSEFENDEDWEEKCVNDFFEVGSSKRVLQKDWIKEGVPFYRTRELVSLSKNEPFGSEIYISEELFLELSKKYGIPKAGDFLVSGVGTLGILYQVKENDKFYFKDGNVIWFKLMSGIVSDYFKHCFHTKFFQKQIFGQSSASTVGTYTISNARKTKFWKPIRKEEQQKIANCLSSADDLIEAQKNKIETLYAHKKGLMQQMFPKTTNI